jgi:pimeloyl-ACP methyl ester carboxylesterase
MNVCRNVSAGLVLATLLAAQGLAESQMALVTTIDHEVPHISTVPANVGDAVRLFVRERMGQGANREAVLMIHGRTVPVLPGMDLRIDHYDWALWLAQAGGFDVFMMDFQGSGRSPRPTMDDPCNVSPSQQALLIPNPLAQTCPPSWPGPLNTGQSDLDELDTVVEYIRKLRGVDQVHLVAWSQGSFRIGPYADQHPGKVASLVFLAPIFNRSFQPGNQPRPQSSMFLRTRALWQQPWDLELKCERQREPGMEDAVWASIMENDELGSTWGPPEGVMRIREVTLLAWNLAMAQRLDIPTLIIQGEFDTGQGGRQDLADLYNALPTANKLRFRVQCAGHNMPWETQRRVLHHISKEWIKHRSVSGFEQGEFFVDVEGNLCRRFDPDCPF